MIDQQSKIFLRMHQSKNLQVSLHSAGRNTGRNCNQSAIHTDESRGDDSDRVILQISLMKHSPLRKVAVPESFSAEINILTYNSGLEKVSVVRAEDTRSSKKLFPLVCILLQK